MNPNKERDTQENCVEADHTTAIALKRSKKGRTGKPLQGWDGFHRQSCMFCQKTRKRQSASKFIDETLLAHLAHQKRDVLQAANRLGPVMKHAAAMGFRCNLQATAKVQVSFMFSHKVKHISFAFLLKLQEVQFYHSSNRLFR
jgi:hypothetical protein